MFTCTASKPGSFINNCVEYEVPEKELVTIGIDFKERQKKCYNKIFLELQIEQDTESERDTKRNREYMYVKYGAYFLGATSTNRIGSALTPAVAAGTRNTIMILL